MSTETLSRRIEVLNELRTPVLLARRDQLLSELLDHASPIDRPEVERAIRVCRERIQSGR